MQIETLSLFLAVAELKSLTKAAEQLYITPQGASAAIKKLEEQLGTKLFSRVGGSSLALTPEGQEIVGEAKRVVGAYRALQAVVAFQGSGRGQREQFDVVASPFVSLAIGYLVEEYVRLLNPENKVSVTMQGAADIAQQFDHLERNTLYILDLPLTLKTHENRYSQELLRQVVNREAFFQPLLQVHFALVCAENSEHANKKQVCWQEIDASRFALHNDPFLFGLIHQQLGINSPEELGLVSMDPEILNTAVSEYGMVSLTSSLPMTLKSKSLKKVKGVMVPLVPEVSFVTGVLGAPECVHANGFYRYASRFFWQSYPSYIREYDPKSFFTLNSYIK